MRRVASPSWRAFTLVELLIVVCIIAILLGLMGPAVLSALGAANRIACASNLHHLGLATQLYLKDHDGWFFPLVENRSDGSLWYFGLETKDTMALGEGNRILDRSQARFAPYLGEGASIETCPSVPFSGPYKPKFKNTQWTYGVNRYLSSHNTSSQFGTIRTCDASRTLIFTDSSQVNTFQAPASPKNPMVEDWYYIEPKRRYVQFRHRGQANVLFADWHVEAVGPAEDSFDTRLPNAKIGYFDENEVLLKPRG